MESAPASNRHSDNDCKQPRQETTTTAPILQRIQQEIDRLHNFFVQWFTAQVEQGSDDGVNNVFQSSVADSLDASFHLVNPQGVITARDPLLEALKSAYGCRKGGVFAIKCKNVQILQRSGNTYLVSYEEWQTVQEDDTKTARISSAWLEEDDNNNKNNSTNSISSSGLWKWKHVHETWLPGMGPASDNQMWIPT